MKSETLNPKFRLLNFFLTIDFQSLYHAGLTMYHSLLSLDGDIKKKNRKLGKAPVTVHLSSILDSCNPNYTKLYNLNLDQIG